MTVVSDTSPVRYLVLVHAEQILAQLFGELVIPPRVLAELVHPHTPEVVVKWASVPPSWLKVSAPHQADPTLDVDPGETEAISLATELNAAALLIDDRKGRNAAKARGLTLIGTLTVLEIAAEQNLISLGEVLTELRRTNFRISESMIQQAIRREEARRARRFNN
jgi:predicted nucleic acid-binding protein